MAATLISGTTGALLIHNSGPLASHSGSSPPSRAGLSQRPVHRYCARMDWPDYLRDQAAMYRQLAEQADDPVVKNEMLELATVCEEIANNIEDRLTGG